MASNIKFKRSAVQNRVPTTSQLDLGELALNTYDGKLYTEINTGSAAVVEIGSKLSSLVVDGANGAGGGDVVFHGTTAGRDLTWDYSDNSLLLPDSVKLKIGSSGDLQLFHDFSGGSENSHIKQTTSKHLQITAYTAFNRVTGTWGVIKDSNSHNIIRANAGSDVKLYFNNSERITTTADGADISGTGSLKIPVGTTAQRSGSPTAGDLRYNSTTGGFEGYSTSWGELGGGGIGIGSTSTNPSSGVVGNRIGVGFTDINIVGTGVSVTGYGTTIVIDFNDFKPGSFHRTIHNYTATAGQTTFTGLNYVSSEKQIAVYLNGARLSESTYTATSGTTVVLDVGASLDDEVEIINIHTNSDVDRKVNTYTATAGQTTFTGLSYNSKQELDVYLNGIRLASADYTATSGSTVVLAVGASVNDTVDIVSTGDGVTFRSTSDSSGDRFTFNNVGIGQDTTPDKLNVTGNVKIVGVLTATTLHGDGSNLTNTGSTLSEPSSGTQRLVTTSLTTGTMTSSGTGSELAFDYANNHLEFLDNVKATFGTGGDLAIFHQGGTSIIKDINDNPINIQSDGEIKLAKDGNAETYARFIPDGAVELYFNNNKRFTSSNYGTDLFGQSTAAQLRFKTQEGTNRGMIGVTNGNVISILDAQDHNILRGIKDGACELYHDNGLRFRTDSTGIAVVAPSGTTGALNLQANGGNTNNDLWRLTASHSASTFSIQNNASGSWEDNIKCSGNGAAELYYDNTKRFETTSTGASVTGNLVVSDDITLTGANYGASWDKSNDHLIFNDGAKAVFGTGEDLVIRHASSQNRIQTQNNITLYLKANVSGTLENMAKFVPNGAAELYYDNTKRFETTNTGASVTGNLDVSGVLTYDDVTNVDSVGIVTARQGVRVTADGSSSSNYISVGAGSDLKVYHNGSHNFIDSTNGQIRIRHGTDNAIKTNPDGAVILYFDGSQKIQTTTGGIEITGETITNSHIELADNAQLKLGTGEDLKIYHNGTDSFIDNSTGGLKILGDVIRLKGKSADETMLKGSVNGAVELYHNNSKKMETIGGGNSADGINVFGNASNSAVRMSTSDGTLRGIVYANSSNIIGFLGNNGNWALSVENAGGNTVSYNHFNPSTDSSLDLGTNSVRWRNVYADTLYGDGSNLTGITQTTINNNADNRVITGSGTANTLNAESTLTFSDRLTVNVTPNQKILLQGSTHPYIQFFENTTAKSFIQWHADGYLRIKNDEDGSVLRIKDAIDFSSDNESSFHSVWHAGNDGSGSGLDADTLDGVQGSSFVRSDASDTLTGSTYTLSGSADEKIKLGGATNPYIRWQEGTTNRAYMQWSASDNSVYIWNSEENKGFKLGSTAQWYDSSGYGTLWHSRNDGSGSGLDADTLDGVQGSSFVRSDADDTMTGRLSLTTSSQYPLTIDSSNDGKIVLQGSNNPYIRLREGSTDKAYFQYSSGSIYIVNQNSNDYLIIGSGSSGFTYHVDGSNSQVWHATNDGSGSGLDADTLDGSQATDFVRGGQQSSVSGWHTSAYRNGSGTSPHIYMSHSSGYGMHINTYNTSSSVYALELHNNSKVLFVVKNDGLTEHGGHVLPASNNTYDLGSTGTRWRNLYVNDLQLSNEAKKDTGGNEVDGTWGNYTIQEGENDLFLINRRSGKKYKFNLTEVS